MNPIKLGADYRGDHQCVFTLWAPLLKQAAVHLIAPEDRLVPMTRDERGYWHATVTDIDPGALYFYQWDGETERPDPVSHSQPQGVHGPSRVVDHAFAWTDAGWRPTPLPASPDRTRSPHTRNRRSAGLNHCGRAHPTQPIPRARSTNG